MLLVLSEDHKEHLSFLTKAEGSVVEEFGRIALEFLRKGTNPKIYEGAARKLCVPVGMVQHGVEGLMFLMTESSKHMLWEMLWFCLRYCYTVNMKSQYTMEELHLKSMDAYNQCLNRFVKDIQTLYMNKVLVTGRISEVDFMDSVLALGFSEELNQSLLQLYVQHKHQIRSILSQLLCNQPAYHNLEWRLDVQLASRSVRRQIVPMVTIRLLLTRSSDVGSTQSCMDLQMDPSSLLHMISTLEAALAAVKTSHARRILRNIK